MNRNVALNLLLAATMGTADSIWTGTMLVALLSALTNDSNTKIGLVHTTLYAADAAGCAYHVRF